MLKRLLCKHHWVLQMSTYGSWIGDGFIYKNNEEAGRCYYQAFECSKCGARSVEGSGLRWRGHTVYKRLKMWRNKKHVSLPRI